MCSVCPDSTSCLDMRTSIVIPTTARPHVFNKVLSVLVGAKNNRLVQDTRG